MADFTRESWARDLLTRMGYPVSDHNMTSVLAWQIQEGGHFNNGATFNPLNSTLGHKTFGSMNSVGVATYPDYETGMAQTIKTINLGYYDKIRADLKADADPSTTVADIKASPWGTWHGGASTTGALNQARRSVAAHPVTAVPQTPAPAATTPAPAATPQVLPVPASAPTPTPPAPAPATGTTGSFTGADVDGLDHLATEFNGAAEIVDMVKTACEAIVAAASFFGPFAAAFIAYLKGTVIPWLTKIAAALRAMSKVLSQHSTAQRDASSASTSLPSYTSPAALTTAAETPSMSATPDAPTTPHSVATTTESWLGGLVTVGRDANGRVVNLDVGGSGAYGAFRSHDHWDLDANGNTVASSGNWEQRIGTSADPIYRGSGTVDTGVVRDTDGTVVGTRTSVGSESAVLGTPVVRTTYDTLDASRTDAGVVTDNRHDRSFDVALGPGERAGVVTPGTTPGLPTPGNLYRPAELSFGSSESTGPHWGDGGGTTFNARTPQLVWTPTTGTLGNIELKAGGEVAVQHFDGAQNWANHNTVGTVRSIDVGIGAGGSAAVTSSENPDRYYAGTGGIGVGPGASVSTWDIRHDDTVDRGVSVGADYWNLGAREHRTGK